MQRADCHIHMVLDGVDWRKAIARHENGPDRTWIRERLRAYAEAGFTYLRDGGDRWGAGKAARALAPEFGITYRTPLANLCKRGHYGGFIGRKFADIREYTELVRKTRENGGDFIKIMVSGLMDFDHCGVLTEEGLPAEEIRELVHIAHEEGMPVMLHANGPRVLEGCALAKADSVEHGAYADREALCAMQENGCIWVPTLSPIGNLRGTGRFDEGQVQAIYERAAANVAEFAAMGGVIAPGSDAGAWAVPHVEGSLTEYGHLQKALGPDWKAILDRGVRTLRAKF